MPRSGKRVYEGKHTNETHHRSPRAYFDQLAHPMQDVHSGTTTRAYCRDAYEENVSRCFILSPGWGGKGTRFVREHQRPENPVSQ